MKRCEWDILVLPDGRRSHEPCRITVEWEQNVPSAVMAMFPFWELIETCRRNLAMMGPDMPSHLVVNLDNLMEWKYPTQGQLELL